MSGHVPVAEVVRGGEEVSTDGGSAVQQGAPPPQTLAPPEQDERATVQTRPPYRQERPGQGTDGYAMWTGCHQVR